MSAIDPQDIRREFTEKILSHDYSKGPLLILAGPGTGKTYSLLETMKVQISNGVQLQDFFVTTLTNASVGDFEKDVTAQLSVDFENVSTLHFRAKGIVHQYANRVGLNPSFFVLTDLEKSYLLREIKLHLSASKKTKAKEVKAFLRQYEEEAANYETITMNDFVSTYQKLKEFYSVIDWYDVPYYASKILTENSDVLQKEASKQSFILVDEYQDLNKADQNLIKLISKDSRLLVVGDDDQSIYGGRFACPSGIVNFSSFYQGITEIKLPVCSRCPTPIIKASYSLISNNVPEERVEKPQLIALHDTDKKADGGYVASVGLKSAEAESEFLAAAIKVIMRDNPDKARDIMVLCASRPLGLELIEMLRKNHPEISIEDRLTKEDKESSFLIASYLEHFLDKHNDNLALRMFLGLFLKITPKTYSIIFSLAKTGTLWEGLQQTVAKKILKKENAVLGRFIEVVNSVEDSSIEDKLKAFSQTYPELKEAIDQLLAFQQICNGELNENEQRSVKAATPNGVQFMTMHRSKGLDAKHVFIPFMEAEVRLPAIDIEEQRRLLYVALTRARVSVVLSWAFSRRSAGRHKAGGGGFMRRSRSNFIGECGIKKDFSPISIINRLAQIAKTCC